MSIVASKGQQPVMQFKNSPQQDVVRRHSSDGIGYSVVDLHGVSHVFAAAVRVVAARRHDGHRPHVAVSNDVFRHMPVSRRRRILCR